MFRGLPRSSEQSSLAFVLESEALAVEQRGVAPAISGRRSPSSLIPTRSTWFPPFVSFETRISTASSASNRYSCWLQRYPRPESHLTLVDGVKNDGPELLMPDRTILRNAACFKGAIGTSGSWPRSNRKVSPTKKIRRGICSILPIWFRRDVAKRFAGGPCAEERTGGHRGPRGKFAEQRIAGGIKAGHWQPRRACMHALPNCLIGRMIALNLFWRDQRPFNISCVICSRDG
jgi:hypothetical protein